MDELCKKIIDRISSDRSICLMLNEILNCANVYLFGGAVRNYLDDDFENVRDLDFVVDFKKNSHSIDRFFIKSTKFKKNIFGGYKILSNDICIDMWEMKDTWAFRENKICRSVYNLTKSVFLNIDGIVYSMNNGNYINDCNQKYFEIRKKNILDTVLEENPCVELNLLRALVLCKKYNMEFSDDLKKIFNIYSYSENFMDYLMYLQLKHYGKQVLSSQCVKELMIKKLNII